MDAAAAATAAMRRSGSWLLPMATAADAASALALGRRLGLPVAMPVAPAADAAGSAAAWARRVVVGYEPMRAMLASARWERWISDAPMPFVAAVDACASESDSALRWAAFSALAYGARGVFWTNLARCAPLGSDKFGLIASINTRLAGWGNTFVTDNIVASDFGNGGYNVTRMWSSGFDAPHAVAPGAAGPDDLVQAADADVLVVRLGSMGRPATPLIYVVDMRVSHTPGAAAARTLRVALRSDVTATQPVEGDCAASRCQCGLSILGSTVVLRLPGGAGQLVALSMHSGSG